MPESVATIASSLSRLPSSQATTCGFIGMSCRVPRSVISLCHSLTPCCAFSRKARSRLRSSSGISRRSTPARIADEPDFRRIAQADAIRVEIDLHAARLTRLGVELDIGEAAADDEQRIAGLERVLRGPGAEQTDAAGRVGAVVGHAALPRSGLTIGAPRISAISSSSRAAPSAPRPARIATFLPALRMSAARRSASSVGICALSAQACETWCGRLRSERGARFTGCDWKSIGMVTCATP